MTTDVSVHSSSVALTPPDLRVSEAGASLVILPTDASIAVHSAAIVILPGQRAQVSTHSAALALIYTPPPPLTRRIATVSIYAQPELPPLLPPGGLAFEEL